MRRADPFYPVGVWLTGAISRRACQSIRAAGFNSVWSEADLAMEATAAGLHAGAPRDPAGELQVDPSATAADLRVWGWAALLRGARSVSYHAWADLVDERGALTPRGRAAGEFAGVISRNPALFVPLRPRVEATRDAPPGVRVAGDPGEIEAGFLESRDALVLIAINHAAVPQRVTLSFAPGTKQEFWQNMETGDVVTFTMRKDSPGVAHAFAPRDALVLMIRKTSPYDRRLGSQGSGGSVKPTVLS